MFVFRFVKCLITGRCRNPRGQLMFHTEVERADAAAANAAVGVAFFAAGAFAVAAAVDNGDVKNDDFNKTII